VKPINFITEGIIGDAIAVHRELGPGLLESTYEACLASLLSRRGWKAKRQVPMPVIFQGEARRTRKPGTLRVLPNSLRVLCD
jgi:GxxExxY protein